MISSDARSNWNVIRQMIIVAINHETIDYSFYVDSRYQLRIIKFNFYGALCYDNSVGSMFLTLIINES